MYRLDFVDDEWMEKSFTKTPEGYLEGRAIVTNIGVFPYMQGDGGIKYELRPPEEVFDKESLDSLKLKPVTNDHPAVAVTADNIKEYQKGYMGDRIETDAYHISVPVVITDNDTVMDVETGKQAFSCGYTVDLEEKSGVWMGMKYDAIQRNIRYNHLALVDRGRAGDKARMKTDSIDADMAIRVRQDNAKQPEEPSRSDGNNINRRSIMEQNIRIDGVDYKVDKDVAKYIHKLQTDSEEKIKTLGSEVEKLKADSAVVVAERDQLKTDVGELKVKLEKQPTMDSEAIQKAVQDRMVLEGAAAMAEVEIKADMDELAIKKEIIKAVNPSVSEKLDSEDEVLIVARFDVALEKLDELSKESDTVKETLKSDSIDKQDIDEKNDSDSARKRMIDRYKNASKRGQEE